MPQTAGKDWSRSPGLVRISQGRESVLLRAWAAYMYMSSQGGAEEVVVRGVWTPALRTARIPPHSGCWKVPIWGSGWLWTLSWDCKLGQVTVATIAATTSLAAPAATSGTCKHCLHKTGMGAELCAWLWCLLGCYAPRSVWSLMPPAYQFPPPSRNFRSGTKRGAGQVHARQEGACMHWDGGGGGAGGREKLEITEVWGTTQQGDRAAWYVPSR